MQKKPDAKISGKKIAVTGGAGFIGSTLCSRLLEDGHSVIAIDNLSTGTFNNVRGLMNNPAFEFVELDIRNFDELKEIVVKCSYVFHLAAQIHVERSLLRPKETVDTNVMGTFNLLQICKANKHIGMTFASSAEVYGDGVHSESSPLNPKSPYAASKVAAEALCTSWVHSFGVNVRIIRNFNTFGPKQKGNGYGAAIAIFVKRALAGLPLTIYGDGLQTRDYQFISDAVEGYIRSAKMPAGTIVNTGSGKDRTILDIAKAIIAATESESKITHVAPRVGEVRKLEADMSHAAELGHVPSVSFEDGLLKLISWMKDHDSGSLGVMN